MNSEIELKSIPNEGSEFSFVLDFKVDKFKNEQKTLDTNLKILLHCSDGNNDKLRQNIQNHIGKIGIISDYSDGNKKGDILFCCGMNNLDNVIEEFKNENNKSLIIYVGDSSNITNNKIKEEINHYLELPIYGSKIYNILVEHTDINKHVIKKSKNVQKFVGKVLVAEDNPNNQKLIEILLSKIGVQTIIVSNGEEAVESYNKEKYDMILMDINMPIMDGITATKIIKDLEDTNYKIPIVALTANSIAGDKEKYLSQGMDDYLSKPIEFDKLVSIFGKYLQNDFLLEEVEKITPQTIAKELQIPDEIAQTLYLLFKKEIIKDLDELSSFIKNFDIKSIEEKIFYIKNSCVTVNLLSAISILEKMQKEILHDKENLMKEFDKLNKTVFTACDL